MEVHYIILYIITPDNPNIVSIRFQNNMFERPTHFPQSGTMQLAYTVNSTEEALLLSTRIAAAGYTVS
ncbi:hypothetical protein P9222_20580 [Paenibacillus amylolyticus]|nr:hypothetical protein [Paenibacillus amylolyticus]WFR60924.1 hypothetical protein P9222_20580 [Paenibacillus amylolyticus]